MTSGDRERPVEFAKENAEGSFALASLAGEKTQQKLFTLESRYAQIQMQHTHFRPKSLACG
jgi:hypothetical protein